MPHVRFTSKSKRLEGKTVKIKLRHVTADDAELLVNLFALSRGFDLDALGWDPSTQQQFFAQQVDAQRRSYEMRYPTSTDAIVLSDAVAVGRILVDRSGDEIVLVDLCLLPGARGRSIGAQLLADLQTEAARIGRKINLQVTTGNPAQRLYERLGFTVVADQGMYQAMEWVPVRVAMEATR